MKRTRRVTRVVGVVGVAVLATVPEVSARATKKMVVCVTSSQDASGAQLYTDAPSLARDASLRTDSLTFDTIQAGAPCPTAVYTISYSDASGATHPVQITNVQVCGGGQATDCASAVPDGSGNYIVRLVLPGIPTSDLSPFVGMSSGCTVAAQPPPPYFQTAASEQITDIHTEGTLSGEVWVSDGPCQGDGTWF